MRVLLLFQAILCASMDPAAGEPGAYSVGGGGGEGGGEGGGGGGFEGVRRTPLLALNFFLTIYVRKVNMCNR